MQTRRGFLHTAVSAGSAAALPAAKQPNILWILADQFRFDCIRAHGNRWINTPGLDRLAARSVDFHAAYVQAPVCVPSRVTLFTGRYPHSHKNRVNYTPADSQEVFLQRRLKDAGYRTGSVGKLHLYPPTADHARSTGFDEVLLDDGVGETDRFSDYVKWRREHDPQASVPLHTVAKNSANPFRGVVAKEYTPTAWTGNESAGMLRRLAAGDQPFFLHCSFFKPHSPYTVPAPWDSMYSNVEIPLPPRMRLNEVQQLPAPVQKQILRFTPQYDMDRTRLEWIWRSYYAGVSMVDEEIGRILDELERSGKADNTLVVFTTDHGDQLLEHGLEGKNVFFESSVHIPLLISLPGRIRPAVSRSLVGLVDLVPTVLELCGIEIPARTQGRSVAPLLTGSGAFTDAEAVFAENIIPEVITGGRRDFFYEPGKGIKGIRHPDAKMIRTARWKLNYYPGNGGELYDMQSDPGETRNLYTSQEHAAVVSELKTRLMDWLITADEADQIAPKWLL